jgi:predicted ATPase/CYTH domain-containing protein
MDDANKDMEHERRWVVESFDPDIMRVSADYYEQGYFESPREQTFRVRIVNEREAVFARKFGRGISRIEKPHPVPLSTGRFVYDATPYRVQKERRKKDGWEFDLMKGVLEGLAILEREEASAEALANIELPSWVHRAKEVTHSVTNYHLAKLAFELESGTIDRPIRDFLPLKRIPRIVLTGGPCSGKSTILEILRAEFGADLHCVPEAASIVIAEVGIRPPENDWIAMQRFQRRLARVQREFEGCSDEQAARDDRKALLLDRGVVDNAAYIHGGLDLLAEICGTSREAEFSQYDLVICLDVPSQEIYKQHKASNPARSETYEQAVALMGKIKEAWKGHPWFEIVTETDWDRKVAKVRELVERRLRMSRDDLRQRPAGEGRSF